MVTYFNKNLWVIHGTKFRRRNSSKMNQSENDE